jgi:hypothetical protein
MTTSPAMTCPKCWGKATGCTHCKATGSVPDVQLSPSFKLSEFIKSNTAKARGIPNVPDARIIENLKGLAVAMEPVKGTFGDRVSITSGFRCPALNKAIGGNSESAHCQGYAVDFVVSGMDATQIMRWLVDVYPAPWDQAIDEPGWFHLGYRSPDGKRQRKQTLVMRGGKYTSFKG